MRRFRGYIFSRPFLGERVPQSVQNLVIRDFCNKNKIFLLLSATEYAMKGSDLMLFKIVQELQNIEGIVLYSIFQLPEVKERRLEFLNKVLSLEKSVFFALEGILTDKKSDLDTVNDIWNIKKTLPKCLNRLSQ